MKTVLRLGLYKSLRVVGLSFVLITGASAEPPVVAGMVGNYFGLQLGTSNIHAQNEYLPNSQGDLVLTRPSRKGFGTRVFWGYQFINYLGLEGGYAYYTPATYNIQNGNSPELRLQAFDILGKGVLPLFWGISAFAKAGAAIVFYNLGGLLSPNPQSAHDGSNGVTVRPEFGLGLGYAFASNWTVDISANRITQGSQVPKTDYFAIGLSYHAVDLFCGQFLC
ncbi:MAG TPA: outer membrane beta-barrel protein [Gammaproteobacteria bacterium]|nr:outer membrane beta-barrel protein [Gammaproteobacteria bacterium]